MTTPAPTSPLDTDRLESALRPFGESTMLPAEAYTSPAVLAWERRHFFAASWVCVGRVADLLPEGRTQVACPAGDVRVLVARDQSGDVRAFANTCRHRGHELLAEGETSGKRAVVCPYHAWSYDLEGALLAAPGFRDVAAFDPSQHGLVPLPVEVWHGWIFVNGLGSPRTLFTEHLGGLAELVATYVPEKLVLGATHDYAVHANWKVITENFHECYHCPLIHPELCQVSPPSSGSNYELPGAWVGGSMDLRDDAVTMSLDGRSGGRPIDGAHLRQVLYLGLLPNLLLSLHPDYVMTHRMTPVSPGETRVECAWYFPDADVDPAYAVDFWDRTNRQDWAACESVQRGISSPHFAPGPLAPNEDAVHQFVTTIARGYQMGGLPV
jgi:Rieske 2Fe-2S family protein